MYHRGGEIEEVPEDASIVREKVVWMKDHGIIHLGDSSSGFSQGMPALCGIGPQEDHYLVHVKILRDYASVFEDIPIHDLCMKAYAKAVTGISRDQPQQSKITP